MLAYFPAIYPDELLYSVLARYYLHVGLPPVANSLEALFGRRSVIASYDLIGSLNILAERIPADRKLTAEILLNMTLYPYCVAFEPGNVQVKVKEDLLKGKVLGIHLKLGLATFRIGRLTHLRFCAACQKEMLRDYGELYWRQSHQLDSVLICIKHGTSLQRSSVALDKTSRHGFIAASLANCFALTSPRLITSDSAFALNQLKHIAELSVELLSNPSTPKSFDEWTIYYRNKMIAAGLAKSACTMNQKSFCKEFKLFYADTLICYPHVFEEDKYPNQWLQSMVRRHRKASHPLYHVLLQNFLNQRMIVEPLFGHGPWSCPNPLVKHQEKYPISNIQYHRNHGRTVASFICNCGYVYTRWYDSTTKQYGPIRFLRYGPSLFPTMVSLVNSKKSLRAIGRTLLVDPKTVIKLCSELGIETVWRTNVRHSRDKPIFPENRNVSKPADAKKGLARAPRVDWNDIDSVYVTKILKTSVIIKQVVPPIRVTLAEIERRTCKRGWLVKRLHLLPKSKRLLSRSLEALEAFQLRRIFWAKNRLDILGLPIDHWRIARLAGLKPKSYPLVTHYLQQINSQDLDCR